MKIPRILLAAALVAPCLPITGCRNRDRIQVYTVTKEAPETSPAPVARDDQPGPQPILWTAPSSWKKQAPGPMRVASYEISTPEGTANASVSKIPGAAGDELGNVNRWRGQIGLPPVGLAELPGLLSKVPARGASLDMVDLRGPQNSTLAAWLRTGGAVWFFKLTGPGALVAAEREHFMQFLRSVRPSP